MVSETVDFVEAPDTRSWNVRARYVFANERDRTIRTTMVFPYTQPNRYCSIDHRVQADFERAQRGVVRRELERNGFAVRLDGVPVPATFSLGVTCDGGERYPFGHYFQVELAPSSSVDLEIQYTQQAGPAVSNEDMIYCPCHGLGFILETGTLWNGPIGEVLLRYHLAYPTAFVRTALRERDFESTCPIPMFWPGEATIAGVPFVTEYACTRDETVVTLRAREVEPTGNVHFIVHGLRARQVAAELQGCPLDPASRRPTRDCCAELRQPFANRPPRDADSNWQDEDLPYYLEECHPGATIAEASPGVVAATGAPDAAPDPAPGAADAAAPPSAVPAVAAGPAAPTASRPGAAPAPRAPTARSRSGCGCSFAHGRDEGAGLGLVLACIFSAFGRHPLLRGRRVGRRARRGVPRERPAPGRRP